LSVTLLFRIPLTLSSSQGPLSVLEAREMNFCVCVWLLDACAATTMNSGGHFCNGGKARREERKTNKQAMKERNEGRKGGRGRKEGRKD